MLTSMTGFSRDAALPARDLMLDERFIRDHLNEPGLLPSTLGPVLTATRVRTKYRIGESLRTVHRLRTDAGLMTVSGRMFGEDDRAVSTAPDESHRVGDPMLNTLWWIFPDDRRMRGIGRLLAADRDVASRLNLLGWQRSVVVEYAPERSITIRAEDAGGHPVAYVKAYPTRTRNIGSLAARYTAVESWLAAWPVVASPGVLGAGDGMLALQPMPGRTWAEGRRGAGHVVLHRLGQGIAHLHLMPADAVPIDVGPFDRLRIGRVVHGAELIVAARPDVAGHAAVLTQRLVDQPPQGPTVFLHGDCHPKNAIVGDTAVALIDLDQSGIGDAACDIASLLARLLHGVLRGELTRGRAVALASAFLTGYASVHTLPDRQRLCWHLAAALIAERALRAVNRVNVDALGVLEATMAMAVEVLDEWPFPQPEV